MYAILDIETTGGQYNEEGITEIAIYKFDGNDIVDQFVSLINPEIPIQPFVITLTGINNAMLYSAPKFYEIAKRIIEITEGCILVAHNASFDYRILKTEFRRLGYNYNIETLCTVELSKKLIPNQISYSLGKLTHALGILVNDRHRANGDALATVNLFKVLLEKDSGKEIVKSFIRTEIKSAISPKLQAIMESVPAVTGIYYIYKEDGSLLYIGKNNNIKKRLNQHFISTSKIDKQLQKQVYNIIYENTGNELIALLKEEEEIRINKPIYNKIKKNSNLLYALYTQKDQDGYLCLVLTKMDTRKKEILTFTTYEQGEIILSTIVEKYHLSKKRIYLFKNKVNNIDNIKNNNIELIDEESTINYNRKVRDFITEMRYKNQYVLILDKGRTIEEHSVVFIEEGICKGYAFYNLNYQINTIEVLRRIITPMKDSKKIKYMIQSYITRNKNIKIIYMNQK